MSTPTQTPTTSETVKDTLIAILIAFMLAFIARVFVCEPFVIPTGSMAPTLLGAHMRVSSPQSGRAWSAGPRSFLLGEKGVPDSSTPTPIQRAIRPTDPLIFHDAHTGEAITYPELSARAGDRIFVLKYIYALREPTRYDVVVFKNPIEPSTNFIKRLVALPGEQVALIDGDVFTRKAPIDCEPSPTCWDEPGWVIRRKPVRVQRAVWQSVYDSASVPVDPTKLKFSFVSPLQPTGGVELLDGGRSFVANSAGAITFDPALSEGVDAYAELCDRNAYNEGTPSSRYVYPVSDIRVRLSVEPMAGNGDIRVAPTLRARGHEYRAVFEGQRVSIEMRGQPTERMPEPAWITLKSMDFAGFARDRATCVELWHFDQSLHVFVDDREVGEGVEYDWNPSQRIFAATGMAIDEFAHADMGSPVHYRKPSVRIELSTGVRVKRVTLERDLHYQPGEPSGAGPMRACSPMTSIVLGPDQFFVCGDNSSASADSRAWTNVDPWVASQLDATPGVVPRRLMLGRAFFVYLPALAGDSPAPVPDFGRMRFIQ